MAEITTESTTGEFTAVTESSPVAENSADWSLTDDDLPYSDGMPMESYRHVMQMKLLMDPLMLLWANRDDVFVGGNMFVYFSPTQSRNEDFRGPDVFVVLGVPRRSRKSWVVWQEGKPPDVVIELLSESTEAKDRDLKKQIYQDRLMAPEYFWFDPFTAEQAGFARRKGVYEPILPDDQGHLASEQLGLTLAAWPGTYGKEEAVWLRWATLEGSLLPTPEELADQESERANQESERANQEQKRAERLAARLRALGIDPEEDTH